MYISSFPKAALLSALADFQAFSRSSSFQTALIPLPPPPALALSITGYPVFLATFTHVLKSGMIPSLPGTQGTPASIIVVLAIALSPIRLIMSSEAPINLILCSSHNLENLAFSERKPYPG